MTISETKPRDYTARYTLPRHGDADGQEAWRERCKKDRESQTVKAAVSRGCSVDTITGVKLREHQEVKASDVGGGTNLESLRNVGAVQLLTENELGVNTGKFGHIAAVAFTYPSGNHGGKVYDVGEGIEASQLDVPGTDGFQTVGPNGKLVAHEGRPAVDGEEKLRELVRRGFIREQKRRAAVKAAIRKATGK